MIGVLLPSTDTEVLLEVVATVVVAPGVLWLARHHRDLRVFMVGMLTLWVAFMALRSVTDSLPADWVDRPSGSSFRSGTQMSGSRSAVAGTSSRLPVTVTAPVGSAMVRAAWLRPRRSWSQVRR
ncbi:MAG: hypothetical protein ACR2JQ_09905 [Mycobacteriales bacterium]